jgi:Abnormal spindle-like microcephaly-assoc'd, ASPM-SPD-2-Hydin
MRNSAAVRRNWLGATLALAAALVSISCGGAAVATNHSTTGTQTAATLTLNSSSVDFGNVSVGSTKTNSITVTNSSASGGPDVTFSQVTASGGGFSATTATLPIVLSPGQSSTITISFAPKSAGAATGSLSITEEGAPDPSMVSLTGTGVGAGQLGVSPAKLNFGNVTVGSSQSKTGSLTAGSSSIKIASAAWTGQGYSVSGISFPVTVAAGQSISFTVTFTPQAAGSSPGSISFVSNASNSPSNETFSGTGTQSSGQNPPPTGTHSVALTWDASTSQVSGYNVYRASGGGFARLNSALQTTTAYTDSTVQSGATYSYVTTAVDSSGEESSYSNQVSATIPNP